jgi:hypothetical protein
MKNAGGLLSWLLMSCLFTSDFAVGDDRSQPPAAAKPQVPKARPKQWKYRGPWLVEGSRYRLLMSPAVQDELAIADDKKKVILGKELSQLYEETIKLKVSVHMRWTAEKYSDLREAGLIRLGQLERKLDVDTLKQLDAGQKRRLDEIALQQAGPLVIVRPEMAQRLGIAEPNLELMMTIVDEIKSQDKEALIARAGPPIELPDVNELSDPKQKAIAKAWSERVRMVLQMNQESEERAAQAAARILTRAQKKTFEKLRGEPFDLTPLGTNYVPPPKNPKPSEIVEAKKK